VTPGERHGRDVLRHSSAHVLAQAVTRLWPGAKYAIGPAIDDGFYYDFELPGHAHFSDDDLARIDAEMRAIIAEDQPFTRHEYTIDEGLALFADQPFKVEIINAVAHGAHDDEDLGEVSPNAVSTYSNSPAFTDLCRGPHVPSTARLGHFKLTRVAGAYWRGDEKRPSSSASTARRGSPTRRWPRTSSSSNRPNCATTAARGRAWTSSPFPPRSVRASRSFTPRAARCAA
jgi:threonyl-tRNA synthetase